MTGAVGAIALNYVAGAKADGYTLLMGAENPLLYKVMDVDDKAHRDFRRHTERNASRGAVGTSYNEDYKTYLPWGPFFGVFAPKAPRTMLRPSKAQPMPKPPRFCGAVRS
tara:strand:+ start:271 stop:600 length:330 start_codon:yes stop_codon:yes gene_type:complete